MRGCPIRLDYSYKDEAVLRITRLSRPRRCNTRRGKRAVKYFWRVEHTSYGQRSIFKSIWNRKTRKWVFKLRNRS